MSDKAVSDNPITADAGDDKADAVAAIALIAIVVATVAYWLSGMPV